MQTKLALAAIVALSFLGSHLLRARLDLPDGPEAPQSRQCKRIISMAPSITETLFALGQGDRVVGATRFCDYPPQAKRIPRVGGYLDVNFEAIVALKPELVVMLTEHQQTLPAFGKLRLNSLVVCHKNVGGILDSFSIIGRACGAEAEARRIRCDVEARMRRVRQKTAGLPRPRVMFAIERTLGTGKLEDVYIAGSDGFFDNIITLAGGQNVYQQGTVRFPVVSGEGILNMNPQVVVDIVPGLAGGQYDEKTILADWQQFPKVEAVKNRRVHLLDHDYAFVPGPRFILLVEKLARLIHPEVDWQP